LPAMIGAGGDIFSQRGYRLFRSGRADRVARAGGAGRPGGTTPPREPGRTRRRARAVAQRHLGTPAEHVGGVGRRPRCAVARRTSPGRDAPSGSAPGDLEARRGWFTSVRPRADVHRSVSSLERQHAHARHVAHEESGALRAVAAHGRFARISCR
jgi:hypothetical protein